MGTAHTAHSALGVNEAAAGAAAGVTGTLLGFPLDVLKARMQSGSSGGLATNARAVLRSGTVYRGVTAPLVSMTLLNTVSFATYAHTRQLVGLPAAAQHVPSQASPLLTPGPREAQPPWWLVTVAGSLVAVPVTLVSTPFELLKLQQQLAPGRYSGSTAAAASIVAQHGASALLRGLSVNFVREVVFLGCYFTLYERAKASLSMRGIAEGVAVPVAGGSAGACAWLLSFPLDTCKTMVQGRALDAPRVTAMQAGQALWRAKGFSGLYSGALPSVLRAFLVSGTRFSVYELTVTALRRLERVDEAPQSSDSALV